MQRQEPCRFSYIIRGIFYEVDACDVSFMLQKISFRVRVCLIRARDAQKDKITSFITVRKITWLFTMFLTGTSPGVAEGEGGFVPSKASLLSPPVGEILSHITANELHALNVCNIPQRN